MKKCVIFLLLFPAWVSAQNKQLVEASSGEDLTRKVSTQIQFLFPEFTNGDVFYKGNKGSGKLNYNMLLGEMQFLENNKVLSLANVNNVLAVNIANRRFYPYKDNEFVEELATTGDVHLRVRYKGNAVTHSKKGAYGSQSSTSSITSYNSIIGDNNNQYELTVTENVLVTVNYFYYLVGKNGKYTLITNVKTFTKLFPAYRAKIEDYVKERNTKFNNADDLKALLKFCSELK